MTLWSVRVSTTQAIKKRASSPPSSNSLTRRPGGAKLHPGKEHAGYFFFAAFLAFFFVAFFAFFAFLAIVSSQGFMVKRDTRDARRRASLATSSTTSSADSQVSAPHCHICVIALSTVQMPFRVIFARESALQRAAAGEATWLTIRQSPGAVHDSKTKGGLSQISVRFR
ncbi:hypothetical protein [Bradyrhizobium cosmicum]|uniref:hypothetical protein n=1 Tax=Bradyrhizobium cosmicum TaxID=1404864 RepID=UPI001181AC91|nr:hypothetical protein [Bradyrhizobium cosmicum]